jgi:aryl-alcohol dehydrogenase-like predicted oxidoreductase
MLADLRGWSPFVAVQLPYNVADRDAEREVFPMAAALGLAVTPWGVLSAGVLTGKPAEERRWPEDRVSEGEQRLVEELRAVADGHHCKPAQAAIAWLLARPAPPVVVPILEARTEAQAVENLAALDLRLDDDALACLDSAGEPRLGFPRSFLESTEVRGLIFGRTFERLVPA